MKLHITRIALALGLLAILGTHAKAIEAQQSTPTPNLKTNTTIPSSALLQPADLVRMLQSPDAPMLLQVGSRVLYAEAHIPNSEYVGAAGTSAGLQALRERVSTMKKDQLIVIYCGCCPWGRCPNIRPAYAELQRLGFTHVEALFLADNFGKDWADKGYPVTKGR